MYIYIYYYLWFILWCLRSPLGTPGWFTRRGKRRFAWDDEDELCDAGDDAGAASSSGDEELALERWSGGFERENYGTKQLGKIFEGKPRP